MDPNYCFFQDGEYDESAFMDPSSFPMFAKPQQQYNSGFDVYQHGNGGNVGNGFGGMGEFASPYQEQPVYFPSQSFGPGLFNPAHGMLHPPYPAQQFAVAPSYANPNQHFTTTPRYITRQNVSDYVPPPSVVKNEVDAFFENILAEQPKIADALNNLKRRRQTSPLPNSVPRAPRAMLGLPPNQTPSQTPSQTSSKTVSPSKNLASTSKPNVESKPTIVPSQILTKPVVTSNNSTSSITKPEVECKPQIAPKQESTPPKALIGKPVRLLVCYNCLSKQHVLYECTKDCPHCGENGHRAVNCNFRTLQDGTRKFQGYTEIIDEDTIDLDKDKKKRKVEKVHRTKKEKNVHWE